MTEFKLIPMTPLANGRSTKPVVIPLGSARGINPHALHQLPSLSLDQTAQHSRQQIDTGESIRQKIDTPSGPVWLEGDSLLCGCPDCAAPMSIRLLLSAASCWRCETSISLSAEQIAAAEELVERNRTAQEPRAVAAAAVTPIANRELDPTPRATDQ